MMRFATISLLLLSLLGVVVGCVFGGAPSTTMVQLVTVVVTGTPGATSTPLLITQVQTVVVSPTSAIQPSATPTPVPPEDPVPNATATPTADPSAQSLEPTREGYLHRAPRLVAPDDSATLDSDAPLLEWQGPSLTDDQYYEVIIERLWQNQPYYIGSEWVQKPRFEVPSIVRGTSDTDQYTWWVTIKQLTGTNTAGSKVGEAISPPSEQRTFTWSPD